MSVYLNVVTVGFAQNIMFFGAPQFFFQNQDP